MHAYLRTAIAAAALAIGPAVLFGDPTLVAGANVPFEFTAGEATLPAGQYDVIQSDNPSGAVLVLRNGKTGKSVMATVVTRLAARTDGKNVLVFDVAGDKHTLSEVHSAGVDGYVVATTKAPHTHALVGETPSPKKP